jgi:ATP-dependent protease ClpP protease subunit
MRVQEHENRGQNVNIVHTRLVGQIDERSVGEVMKDIDQANVNDVSKIVLTIASHGGWLYPAFALYEHIKASDIPVDTVAEGYCMSSALMVLQAGRERISRPHARFMLHPSDHSVEERKPYQEFITIVEENKRNHELFVRLTIERCGISKRQFERMYQSRTYFSAQEAIRVGKHGLIDRIE